MPLGMCSGVAFCSACGVVLNATQHVEWCCILLSVWSGVECHSACGVVLNATQRVEWC